MQPDLSLILVSMLVAVMAGTLGGVVGFGSGVILLPICNFMFGPRVAVPVLTLASLLGNLSRAAVSYRDIDWRITRLYLSGAIPAALLGSLAFVRIDAAGLPILFGMFVIATVPLRRWAKRYNFTVQAHHFPWIGAVMGFLSAVVSSTGPVNAPFFLAYGLVRGAYLATEALGTAGVHITKSIVYGRFDIADSTQLLVGLGMGACMVLGSYLGKKVVSRLDTQRFLLLVEVLLIVSGVFMIGQAMFVFL